MKMIKLIKRMFSFYFISPLNSEECLTRFSDSFKYRLMEIGSFPKYRFNEYWDHIYQKENGVIEVDVTWTRITFTYMFTLEPHGSKTLLHCRHNPLGIFSLGPIVILAACFVAISIFKVLESGPISAASILVTVCVSAVISCLLFGGTAAIPYYYARKRLAKTMYYLVLAVPLADSMKHSK